MYEFENMIHENLAFENIEMKVDIHKLFQH